MANPSNSSDPEIKVIGAGRGGPLDRKAWLDM